MNFPELVVQAIMFAHQRVVLLSENTGFVDKIQSMIVMIQ